MLTKADKDKIIELREQGFSYKAIREKFGFAVQTISNVIKEHEERKKEENEEKEQKNKKIEKDKIQTSVVSFDSAIDEVKKISDNIDKIIKKGQLKDLDRREWQKRKEDLEELLIVEVDDRIVAERADAVATRDEEWKVFLKQNYAKKEVVTSLDNAIISKDATIKTLENAIEEKDALLRNKQYEISRLKDSHQREKEDIKAQITNLYWENQGLKEENWKMHNFIQNYSDNYERREQEYLKHERELSNEKKTFNREVKEQELKRDKEFFELDKKYKEIEMRENQLTEQAVKLKKRKDEFNEEKMQLFDALNERIKGIEKREENVTESEKMLKRWIREQKNDLNKERKIIKDNLDKRIGEIKDNREKINKEWENIKKISERQKTDWQRLQKIQTRLKETWGFKKFTLPCSYCGKPIFLDITKPETNQKLSEMFRNYMHSECRIKYEQQKPVTLRPISSNCEHA